MTRCRHEFVASEQGDCGLLRVGYVSIWQPWRTPQRKSAFESARGDAVPRQEQVRRLLSKSAEAVPDRLSLRARRTTPRIVCGMLLAETSTRRCGPASRANRSAMSLYLQTFVSSLDLIRLAPSALQYALSCSAPDPEQVTLV